MNLMFWKKKAKVDEDAPAEEEKPADKNTAPESSSQEQHDSESPVKQGVAAKIKSAFSRLTSVFKKPPSFNAEEGEASDKTAPSGDATEEVSDPPPANLKKQMILGGALFLLVLLFAAVGFFIFRHFTSPPKPNTPKPVTPAASETLHTDKPIPHTVAPNPEIETLKKKNIELQAQIESLKKEAAPLPQPVASTGQQISNSGFQPSDNSELTVTNKDPKATALSLKEAIDAMNAEPGDNNKKSTK